MFQILDANATVVDTADTFDAAMRLLTHVQKVTLSPHHIVQATESARTTVSPTVARSYEAGVIVWDGDILVPATRS